MEKEHLIIFDEIHVPIVVTDILKNIWLTVLSAVIVCMGIFVYGNLIYKPAYTAETTFAISPRSNGSYVSFYASLNTANEMTEVFSEVFSSEVLKRLVREDLQEPNLNFSISCTVEKETNILCVGTTADTPKIAHMVMQSVLENYPQVSDYLFGGVVLDVLKRPQIPTQPSNAPDTRMLVLAGVALAMALEMLAVAMLSILRPTLKTVSAAKRRLEEPPIGTLPRETQPFRLFHKREKLAPLITDANISFQYTEAVLRTAHKLQHKMKKNGQKVLLVTSVAENEGKSTISVNLAMAMAKHGHKVALVDLDLRRPAVYKILRKHHRHDLMACLKNGLPTDFDQDTRLHILTVEKPYRETSRILHSKELTALLDTLRQKMDFIILDSSPYTATADAGILLQRAESCVMVVRQDWVSCDLCRDVAEDLDAGSAEYLGYIFNHYQPTDFAGRRWQGYGKYGDNDAKRVEEG